MSAPKMSDLLADQTVVRCICGATSQAVTISESNSSTIVYVGTCDTCERVLRLEVKTKRGIK